VAKVRACFRKELCACCCQISIGWLCVAKLARKVVHRSHRRVGSKPHLKQMVTNPKIGGREVPGQTLDVTDSAAVVPFVTTICASLGQLGICVTNLGAPPSNMFKNTPPEARRSVLDQLLKGTIYLPGKLRRGCRGTSEECLITIALFVRTARGCTSNSTCPVVHGGLVRSLP